MNKEEMIDKIAKMEREINYLKKEINNQKEKKRRWKPKYGEKYNFINDQGCIFFAFWYNSAADNHRYEIGNVFETYGEAEFALEQFKVLVELKKYANDDKEWNLCDRHWFIEYDTENKCIDIFGNFRVLCVPSNFFFSSQEQAQKAIDAIGKERLKKYYFCVVGE